MMMHTMLLLLALLGVHAEEPCSIGFDCECEGFFDCNCADNHEATWYGGCRHTDQDETFIPLLTCAFDEHCEVNSFLGGHCKAGHEVEVGFFFASCASDVSPPPPSPSPPPPEEISSGA